MLVIDDLLLLPLNLMGINLTPNLFVMIYEALDNFVREELVKEINGRIKENRMLFELGELSETEYAEISARLIEKLNLTKKVATSEYEANVRTMG